MFDWLKILDCRCSFIGNLIGAVGDIAGGAIQAQAQERINQQNIQMQKEFAQNGIQWKVADAEKAGVHKLAALGAQTYQATPSSVAPDVGGAIGNASKHFGQAIDDFIEDKSEERQLQLEKMRLENKALSMEINKLTGQVSSQDVGKVGLTQNDYKPQPLTQVFNAANGDKIITVAKDLMDYVAEKDLKDAQLNGRIYQELEYHTHALNRPLQEKGSNYRYIPASLEEIALLGLPFSKLVTVDEWNKWVDRRKSDAKRDARIQRERKKAYKKWGDPNISTNTTAIRPYRQPTDFDFSYRGK